METLTLLSPALNVRLCNYTFGEGGSNIFKCNNHPWLWRGILWFWLQKPSDPSEKVPAFLIRQTPTVRESPWVTAVESMDEPGPGSTFQASCACPWWMQLDKDIRSCCGDGKSIFCHRVCRKDEIQPEALLLTQWELLCSIPPSHPILIVTKEILDPALSDLVVCCGVVTNQALSWLQLLVLCH